jgi:ribosomal protein L32E
MKSKELRKEVERFLSKLDAYDEWVKEHGEHSCMGSPPRAAARRASLDVTKALAAWRRPDGMGACR